jgi:hypothetical protein
MWSKKHNWFELKIKRIIELKIHGSNHVLKNIKKNDPNNIN